jgi:hypothetical protein
MKSHRGLITAATLVAAALVGPAPVSAQASTLLSGYGGPGQGSQQIIGATLINPPSGGGGGSGGAGGGGSAGAGETLAAAASVAASHAASNGVGVSGQPVSGARRPHQASTGAAHAYPPASGSPAPEPAVGSSALGLSGVDFVYIVLVLGGLVAAGALTRRLATPAR